MIETLHAAWAASLRNIFDLISVFPMGEFASRPLGIFGFVNGADGVTSQPLVRPLAQVPQRTVA